MQILISGIVILFVFLALMLMFPPLSVLFPVYKIKKMKNMDLKSKITVNVVILLILIVLAISGVTDMGAVFIYLVLNSGEFFYYGFKKNFFRLYSYDKMIITSLITAIFYIVVYYYIVKNSSISLEELKKISLGRTKMNSTDFDTAISYIKYNVYVFAFAYSYITNYFIYEHFEELEEGNKKNNISCIWIIPYLVIAFYVYFTKTTNIYLHNIFKIVKVIYIIYGAKFMHNFIKNKMKNRILEKSLIVFITLLIPQFPFLVGVFKNLSNNDSKED